MAVRVVVFPAILLALISLSESTGAVVSRTEGQAPAGNWYPHQQNNELIRELQEARLKIDRLESILDENSQKLNAKSLYLSKIEKQLGEMTLDINHLKTILHVLKDDKSHIDERLHLLEEEVRLLWEASRKNNFEIHYLESNEKDAEKRLEVATSQVQLMVDIVTEQWIQIRRLEQAVQIAEIRASKFKGQIISKRWAFLKFNKNTFGCPLKSFMRMWDPYLSEEGSISSSFLSRVLHQLKRAYVAAKHYHHQFQGYIKQAMEMNDFTAPLSHNREVVFFLASALLTFPLISAWMLLSSQFS